MTHHAEGYPLPRDPLLSFSSVSSHLFIWQIVQILRCIVRHFYRIISKCFKNWYGFDTDKSKWMPVTLERISNLNKYTCWLNVSCAYKCFRLKYNILTAYIILKQFLVLDKYFDYRVKCYSWSTQKRLLLNYYQ